MSEEVILQFMAQDDISPVIQTLQTNVITSMEGIQSAISNMGTGFDNASLSVTNIGKAENVFTNSTRDATNTVKDSTRSVKENTQSTKDNSSAKTSLGNTTRSTNTALREHGGILDSNTDFAKLSAGSSMYLAGQLSTLGAKAEQASQNLNDLKIQVDQVAKMSGMAEDEMVDLVTTISNETFSNDEAALYIKNLTQMGVESKNFAEQATNIDRINDAFGLGAETTNSLVTELSVLGVDANHIESSFNALAYANENTKGGMENFYAFLRKYDAEFNTLGYDMDQASIIISAATQKFGGGRAALTGLSEALKNAGSDTSAMESELGLIPGALSHATQETASYEGQLQSLADEEMEHKTILDRMGAWVDDISLRYSNFFSLLGSAGGFIGQTGNLALTGLAMRELIGALSKTGVISNTVSRLRMFGQVMNANSAETKAFLSTYKGVQSIPTTPTAMNNFPTSQIRTPNMSGVGKNASTMAKETEQVVSSSSKVGALSGPATTAGTGMKATSTGLKGIGSGALSMVAPLLQISVAIMILLAVLPVIAAEALVLIKGLQLLVKALGFDKIDLTKSIEGIKQVGSALWEIGKAMGALTFATLMTALTMVTTGLLQIFNPIGAAGRMLVDVANELKIFNTVNIDKNIPKKIQSITDSIKLVSDAMGELVKLQGGMAWTKIVGFFLGSVKDAIREARQDIVDAGKEIDKIKNVPDLDKGATDKLKKVGSALESMGKAMDGLRSIRDSQNFDISGWIGGLFGGANISKALEDVRQDIYDASTALKSFDGVDTIPEDVGKNLKKVADALKSVGDSVTTLRKLRDDYNWDEGIGSWFADSDITKSLDSLKEDLVTVSVSLKGLSAEADKGGLADVGDELPDKIKKVTDTLDSVLSAIESMEKFKGKGDGENSNDFSGLATTIDNAKTSLATVSKSLASLGKSSEEGGLSGIEEGVTEKLKTINKTLKKLSSAMDTLKTFPVVSGNEIPNRISKAVTVIQMGARHLNNLKGEKTVDESIPTLISSVGKSGKKLSSAIDKLTDFPIVSGNEIPKRVQKAVTVIKMSARHLNNLKGEKTVDESIPTLISSVGKSGGRLSKTISTLRTFPIVSGNEIPKRVQKAVTAVKSTAKQLNKLKGTSVKGGIGSILTAVSDAVSKLKTTLSDIAPSFSSHGQNIGSNLKTGIKTGLNGLGDVVSTGVANASVKGATTAQTSGSTMALSMITGFRTSFLLSETIAAEMSAGLTAITTATPDLTNAMGILADQMVTEFKSHAEIASPGAIARSIRDEMGYTRGFVETHGKSVVTSVGTLATNMVNNFNPNLQSSLDNITGKLKTGDLNKGRFETIQNLRNNTSRTENNNRPVSFVFNEGAIQLDSRNLTVKESRQIMINAIEGLTNVESVNIKGV